MPRRRSAAAALAAALLLLAAAPATTRSIDATVDGLVHQLGADADADRSAAQQELADLGTTAVPTLTAAAAADADPVVRSGAAAALAQIDDRAANGPTLVTIHCRAADPGDVFAALGRDAHADLVAALPTALTLGKDTVTLDADRAPFWDVFADACRQAGVCPTLDAPAPAALRLVAADRSWIAHAPQQTVGPFRVAVAGVYRLSSADLTAAPATVDEQFMARLIVFPEPKLTVTAVSPLHVTEATDDRGHSLVPPGIDPVAGVLARGAARLPARTVEARLLYPADHPGHRIVTLAGELTVTLAQGARPFAVDDLMGRPTVTTPPLPGVRVGVGCTAVDAADTYRVTVDCRRDRLPDDAWSAMVNRVADLSVRDAAGRPLTPLGWTTDAGNTLLAFKATGLFARTPSADVRLTTRPAAATIPAPTGPPQRLVWDVASRFKTTIVPVAFHDLPMP